MTFLPLNLRDPNPRQLLAAVDECFLDDLLQYNWKCGSRGLVVRSYSNPVSSAKEGRKVTGVEHLARRILGITLGTPVFWVNGDPLDCRACNLLTSSASRELFPNRTVSQLDGYAEALKGRTANHAAFMAHQRAGFRYSRLTAEQVRQFLDDVQHQPFLGRKATLQHCVEHLEGETGVRVTLGQMSLILRGESLRVPGYNYEALRASRPTRHEVALQRELELREWRNT